MVTEKKTKLKSMKRTAADKRKDQGQHSEIMAIAPDYPYGLTIHLDRDELDKLGMKELPNVGTVIPICALVKVTRVSQSAVEGRDEEASVDFQITDLGVDVED